MKIKQVMLGLIIGIVLLMFLVFGSKLIYDKPDYSDYCNYDYQYLSGEKLNDSQLQEQNEYFRVCDEGYNDAQEIYSKKMFVLSLIVGILIIIGSVIWIKENSVSGGLMFGSLMFVIYGTGSYWDYMNDWIRFIILGIALGILIYVGYWFGNKEDKKIKSRKKRK